MAILKILQEIDATETLTEADQEFNGQNAKEIAQGITDFFKDETGNKSEKAKVASEIINIIPPELIDDVTAKFKEKFANKPIDPKVKDELKKKDIDVGEAKTFGEMIEDAIDNPEYNKLGKGFILSILAAVALIEPTPIGEIVVGVLTLLPGDKFVKILLGLQFPILSLIRDLIRKNKKEA